MGLIRKTLSISTLGLVSWKSKKELLREAEAQLAEAQADLERTTKVEALLREKLDAAEHRASSAELQTLRESRRARRQGARAARKSFPARQRAEAAARTTILPRLRRTRAAADRVAADLEPHVEEAVESARTRGRKLATQVRRSAEEALEHAEKELESRRKDLEKQTRKARKEAKKARKDLEARARKLVDH